MDTQPAAETEGKSQRVLQPEAERDGSSGVRGIPNSSTYPVVGDPGDTHHGPEQGQGGGERGTGCPEWEPCRLRCPG